MEGLSRLSVPGSHLPWGGTKSPAQGDTRASLGMRDGPQNSQFPHFPPLPSPLPPHCLLLRSGLEGAGPYHGEIPGCVPTLVPEAWAYLTHSLGPSWVGRGGERWGGTEVL